MNTVAPHHRAAKNRAQQSAAIVARGILLNALLAIVKIAGGIVGHTYALIADGVESLLDVFSSSLVWAGLQVASQPPDQEHPYGHGKAESVAGLAVSALIFLAAAWVGEHACHEIVTPHRGPHWGTLPLLAVVVALKIYFSRRVTSASRESGATTMAIESWHHASDALTSAAAFIGISIAVIGGKGYETADDWAALVACVIILWNGVGFLKKSFNDLMDVAAPEETERAIRVVVESVSGVRGVEQLRVRKSGLSLLVDIHVEVDGNLSVREGHDIAGAVKHRLLGETGLHVTDVLVHIEPAPEEKAEGLKAES
ncbi:MAG TPA: cation diffusion facilitator family transporter [Opitutaceae bacterium]